jgi:hypothetical protein
MGRARLDLDQTPEDRRRIDGQRDRHLLCRDWMSPLFRPAHTENRAMARSRLEQVPAQRDATSLRSRPVVSTNSRLFPLEQASPKNSPVPRRPSGEGSTSCSNG